ncbi:MAG: tripartite tricarboxylate transporter permease, partial [Pseudomonadota bacterium]
MDFMLAQLSGFGDALLHLASDPLTYVYLVASVFLGIVFGALPGLTATLAVTILTGFFGNRVPLDQSLIALIGAYVGAIYGGSYPSILLNIPGTAASAATAMDGYPLAKKGRGGEALGLTTTASFLGTLFGTLFLLLFVWLLLAISRNIASPEKALLALFGVLLSGTLMSEDIPLKGWISGLVGLSMAMVGLDPILSENRFTFGWSYLLSGFQVVPVLMGAFAIPQIIDGLRATTLIRATPKVGRIVPSIREILRRLPVIGRSGVIGTGIGALPGVGEDVAGWVSYGVGKASSRDGANFGKGSMSGLISAEAANNAAIGGALIPLLVLGIPGSPPAAALLGALKINNVIPGPTIDPALILHIVAILVMASFTMMLMGIFTARVFILVLRIPRTVFLPIVL